MREFMPRGGFTSGVDGRTISQLPSVYFRSNGKLGFPLRDGTQRNYDALDEPEAKAAMIWIVGQFADRIENADELLDDLTYTFMEESVEVSVSVTDLCFERK